MIIHLTVHGYVNNLLQIHQEDIDGVGAASTPYDPAHCDLSVRWIDNSIPQLLSNDIKMKGINKRSFELILHVEGTMYKV